MKKTLRDYLIANKKRTSPVARLLGMRLVRRRHGLTVLKMKVRHCHLNTIGTIHGGILGDLSDAAMGYAFTTLLAKEQIGMTVEFKINFLKPVFVNDTLNASAEVISHGNTLYYLECAIRNRVGSLVAKATGTCKIL